MNDEEWLSFPGIAVVKQPFPHFSGNQIIKNGGEETLYQWLSSNNEWEIVETDFYTQKEFSLLDVMLPENLHWLTSVETIRQIQEFFSSAFMLKSIALVGITAHQLNDGDRIGIHNDFIDGEESHRLIIQINPFWSDSHGGFLMLFNSGNPQDVAKVIRPVNNSVFGFEISQCSYHAVSTVHNFSRYTLVYTLKAS